MSGPLMVKVHSSGPELCLGSLDKAGTKELLFCKLYEKSINSADKDACKQVSTKAPMLTCRRFIFHLMRGGKAFGTDSPGNSADHPF